MIINNKYVNRDFIIRASYREEKEKRKESKIFLILVLAEYDIGYSPLGSGRQNLKTRSLKFECLDEECARRALIQINNGANEIKTMEENENVSI